MNHLKLHFLFLVLPAFMFSQSDDKQVAFRELTVEQGLSQNSVVSIAQDQTGFMWFATQDGLNKYDGKQFKHFPYQFEDVTRNTFSKLGKIYVDNYDKVWFVANSGKLHKQGNTPETFKLVSNIKKASTVLQAANNDYFIGTYGSGLYKIQHKTKDTIQILKAEDKHLVTYDLFQDGEKVLVATLNGILEIDTNNTYRFLTIAKNTNFSAFTKSLKNDKLFLGSYGKGLFVSNGNEMNFKPFTGFEKTTLPSNLIIQDVLVDSSEKLWVATYGDGAYLIDFKKQTIQHFVANKTDPYALHYNDVLSLYEDFTGIVWLGTDGSGLSYYDEDLVKFNVLTNKQAPDNISIDFVRAIVKKDNEVWLGTSNKGLTAIDFETNSYKMYTTKNSTLSSDRVMSLFNSQGTLWIGHQNSGLQKWIANETFKSFDVTKGMSIWKIYQAANNRLWLCTLNGLVLFDEEQGVVKTYHSKNSVLTSNAIRTVESGNDNQLWIGTEGSGLYVLNTKTGIIVDVKEIKDRIKSLYYNNNILWVGTNGNGIKAYNTQSKTIKHFTTNQGLANNVVYAILPDSKDNLWLSSNKGLTKATIDNDTIVAIENFSNYDGLQTNEFNTGAYFKDEKGMLYFGGLEGLNWFNPNQLSYNSDKPRTIISGFDIFAKPHKITQNDVFSSKQNTMTFTFSSLHYSQPDRNQYKYQLVNHDPNWISSGNNNTAHYTNLPPNDYTFKVISSNYDGVWNETPATYTFTINKPWYLSTLAIICYALLLLGISVWVYKYLKWRWHMKMKLEFEHKETIRLKKLDEFKTKLYTNISHEFRTPLTLITGPIEKQLAKPKLTKQDKKELLMVQDNSKRLLNLVNQMLDLSKLETGHFKLAIQQGDLDVLLKQIAEAFQYKAQQKNIQFTYVIPELKQVWFDRDIVEKIVTNLLSNAVKYAPKNGQIYFETTRKNGQLVMSFINNGNTIPNEQLGKLFQRYYQNQKSTDGVGIGLSLVKELAIVTHGNIVANTINEDNIQFTVTLPIERSFYQISEISDEISENNFREKLEDIPSTSTTKHNSKNPMVLIVEDNKEINDFVATIFKHTYNVIQVSNGEEGKQFALKHIPDVIITDIMMPKLDGVQLCNELKQDIKTSHIPIIMLTAKSGEANEIEGFKTGADAYITKPFNPKKLKLIVNKQLELRKRLQQHYGKTLSITPDLKIISNDDQFLKRLTIVLDKHITNQEFNNTQFCKHMQMSRTQLHRKLTAIFGVSATEFIRTQRLKLAQELLQKSDATIAEIAYQVGFNTPSYFNKCFKEIFGCTPNEYASKHV
ncbi:two-component regulator propeller domain-containing protein [Mangrovimonas spongiae]|uniref:histidine kinase n=1 Tax=Mangrovimonas spongiae TaxID=2494697 RepID=A0A428K1G8_9FLAO|nr:two-component regulator propeller domain-containing protein [Mangrovimonas spongiae]RSK40261.1 response regulator [Mangrovimonas spongiae]